MVAQATETQRATYQIDPAHSQVEFAVKHLVISTVKGRFSVFSGAIEFDPADPATSSVEVSIDADSIDTRDAKRDEHLRSNDFFGVGDHPQLTFRSTRVVPKGGNRFDVIGDLTIAGITREVVLNTEFNGVATSPWGQSVAGFSATTQVNRKDFNINWNAAIEGGGVVVSDTVKIALDVEAVRQ